MAKLHEMCWGAMHKQTMSHLKKHTDSHDTGFSCQTEQDAGTNRRQKKRKGREESQQPALLLTGLFMSSFNKLGHRWAPSLQGILGAFGDTE